MSKNYKNTMDKITVDDKMKKRILNNIDSINKDNKKEKFKKKNYRSLGTLAAAACFSIIVFSVNVKMSLNDKIKMSLKDNKEISFNQTKDSNNDELNSNSVDTFENDEKNLKINEEISSEKTKDNNNITSASNKSISNKVLNYDTNDKKLNNTKEEVFKEKNIEQKTEVNTQENSINKPEPMAQAAYDSKSKVKTVQNEENLDKSFKNLDELNSNIDFSIKTPQEVIKNKDIKNISLKENNNILISYENSDVKLDLEVKKNLSKEEKNNDSKYKIEKNININDKIVSLKGNDDVINTAKWNDNELSYSINSDNGISEDKTIKIIESVK